MSNKLSSVSNYNVENIVFSDAKESNIPGSYRITIGTKNEDGSTGALIFSTDLVYSFGIQENKSLDKPIRTTGYAIPLCLWNKEGPTDYQKQFIDTIEKVSEHIKKYMLKPEVKKSVKKFDLVESDLRKFSPLWYKKEDGQIVEGRGPMLYPKLMCNKDLQIYTDIADQHGNDVEPLSLLNQKCSVRACIKIESIFIGSKISLQVKVLEMEVHQQGNKRQRLICKQAPVESLFVNDMDVVNPLQVENKADELSYSDEDDDDLLQPPSPEPVKVLETIVPAPVKKPATKAASKRLMK
jgi:hypothetical protein